MKRFWRAVAVEPAGEGWQVRLDGRPVRTPARAALALPTEALAGAIASEWQEVGDKLDPRVMPLTGLANAAIDRIMPDPRPFAETLAGYGESDLLCYRADGPRELVDLQSAGWDPLLDWARRRYDAHFVVTAGIRPVPQPPATLARLRQAVASFPPFALAGLSPLVTIGGSLVAALAVAERATSAEEAWQAVSLDERWNLERWGEDELAVASLAGRQRDFLAAATFLQLLRSS